MLQDVGFMPGVYCGAMFGAAGVLLIVSLIMEHSHRKHERQMQRIREMWR